MDELIQMVKNAYHLIGSMSVTGDNQDLCVAAKTELRKAYKKLEELDDTSENKSNK